MLRKLLALLLVGLSTFAYAQVRPGSLKGTVIDKATGETIPTANVVIEQDGAIIAGGATDFDGKFHIKPIPAGSYTVKISFTGYATNQTNGVLIEPNKITNHNVSLEEESAVLGDVVVIEYVVPLIDGNKTGKTTTGDDIVNMAVRDVASIAAQTAGVYQADEGSALSVRGGRASSTDVYIDGIKVRGSSSLPQSAIEQQTVITGGVPAQYGDATSGIISVTTRGPSPIYRGGFEAFTSEPFDSYGNNLIGFNLSGPLWKKPNSTTPVAGFRLTGEYQSRRDAFPSAVDLYKVKDSKLAEIEANPLQPSGGGQGVNQSAEFLRFSDLEKIDHRLNAQRKDLRLQGNVRIQTSKTTSLTLGGSFTRVQSNNYSFTSSLMNYNNNSESISTDWRVFGRFQQSFGNQEEESNSLIKNAFYNIQIDYTQNNGLTQDKNHEDNIFRYGHIGKFETLRRRAYNPGSAEDENGNVLSGWEQVVFQDTAVIFTPGPYNPVLANYTSQVYDFIEQGFVTGTTNNLTGISAAGGLRNGDGPTSIYNLWTNVGAVQAGYSKSENQQFRLTASGSADIGDHSIIIGAEFEQRIDRGYSVATTGMWQRMRQLANQHILQLDLDNPVFVRDENGVFLDTINYNRNIDLASQGTFDRNLRLALGLDPNGDDFINIDEYDPDVFSLNMFSADELINEGGGSFVSYFGYDYTGERTSNNVRFEDFFLPGEKLIAPFQPIYMAGYIQDQFSYEDLVFNIGVRVDRYDANQRVLRDQYVLYPTYTAGELSGTVLSGENIPQSVGDDYVVYVDDYTDPNAIVGFRNGDDWYDAQGVRVDNPEDIANATADGRINPFLVNPDQPNQGAEGLTESFKDYEPQINVMPRISFNFPISDEALFFAHYDVLTERPDGFSRANPLDYLNLSLGVAGSINNPDLKPQKTVDYEIGFTQALNKRSSLTISAFYRELRDYIQATSVVQAFPQTYITRQNLDFGTVKGFSVAYDLRRTNNVSINANYTLQFADGSGSSSSSNINLAASGNPNLRTINPLNFDQRHNITLTVDYRFASGRNYTGPVWFGKKVLEQFGANFVFNLGSGTPYSKRARVTPIGGGGSAVIDGSINGSRLPWQFRIDARVSKSFAVKFSKDEKKRPSNLEVYIQANNLLNTLNVLSVYPFTGNPDDDGFLSSPQAVNTINTVTNAAAFVDLYNIRVNNPGAYSLPRRITLGVNFSF